MLFFAKHINSKNFAKASYFLFLSALFFNVSCVKEPTNYNSTFEAKFGKELEKIRSERKNDFESHLKADGNKNIAQSFEPIEESTKNDPSYYAYADIAKLGDNPRQNFIPDGEVYQQIKTRNPSSALPEDMFVVTYNTEPHPRYSYNSYEFDNVEIPSHDAYGVRTKLLEKPYLMAGNNNVQNSVDHLQKRVNDQNVYFSKTLIAEKKQMRRQEKMLKTFGEDDVENSKKLSEKDEVLPTKDKSKTTNEKPKVVSNITILDPVTMKPLNTAETNSEKKK